MVRSSRLHHAYHCLSIHVHLPPLAEYLGQSVPPSRPTSATNEIPAPEVDARQSPPRRRKTPAKPVRSSQPLRSNHPIRYVSMCTWRYIACYMECRGVLIYIYIVFTNQCVMYYVYLYIYICSFSSMYASINAVASQIHHQPS